MATIPDAELIERVAQKDEQAFLMLYDRYSPRVFALCLKIVADNQAAEEITQDVFLKFWSRARSFMTERGTFSAWLLTIARNTALDRLRLEKRRPAFSAETDPEQVWDLLPQEGSESEESRWRALYFAIQGLPKEQRIVIELAYYQGMSHSEIAEMVGWPIGTVKTRMRMGMEQLRTLWLDSETSGEKSEKPSADVV